MAATATPALGTQPVSVPVTERGFLARGPEEGLVAYRLNLVEALAPPAFSLAGPARLQLDVDREGATTALALLQSSGNPEQDAALLKWLGEAARKAVLPPPLKQQSFTLELQFE